jgi:glycine/D-amino acid oxidase-like deaminating enzyme
MPTCQEQSDRYIGITIDGTGIRMRAPMAPAIDRFHSADIWRPTMTDDVAGITIDTAITFQDPLPDKVDVAIIGGGVIGIFSALYLARKGKSVLVCEKGRIAGEQSSRNWGWIRQQGRDYAELPIMMQALGLWHEVDRATNGQCGVVTAGTYYFAETEADLADYETWIALAREHGLGSKLVSAQDLTDAFSGQADHHWIGGVFTPSDARGEPWLAVPAVARLARNAGATIRENCAVRGLDIAAGRICGVVTEDGQVSCEQAVLCGGAWSSLFTRKHGIEIPQLSVEGTVVQTAPLPNFFKGCAWDSQFGIRLRVDGGYTLARGDRNGFFLGPDAFRRMKKYLPLYRKSRRGMTWHRKSPDGYPDAWSTLRDWSEDDISPFEKIRVLELEPNRKDTPILRQRFGRRFPKIGKPEILRTWAGLIDVMPDVVPIVDRVPKLPGMVIATGMCGHGFGIGPGFGHVVARMVAGEEPEHDLRRFRFSRFTDGSALDLRTSL